jgi:transcriptional regulator with XRE-family HTH domain
MEHKNIVGRQVGRIRSGRGWSQAELARELQKAGWDLSRSEVSKIEMRIREVKDWQMMLLVHVLNMPHDSFYPRLDAKAELRDAFAAAMMKKPNRRASPTVE